ncbi:MAG: hypothetical protein PUE18_10845 [Firmicutes bacterium]|nr:hypothetical protein [Bacillota bacterium]
MAAAGSKEAKQLEQIKNTFDKAYKEMGKASEADSNLTTEGDSDIKYSIAGVNSGTADLSLKDRAVEMRNQGASPEEIWKKPDGSMAMIISGDMKLTIAKR